MIFDLNKPLTTREYDDLFLQISIQWMLTDLFKTTNSLNQPFQPPSTTLSIKTGTEKANSWLFELQGEDAIGNQYKKHFMLDLEDLENGKQSYVKFVPSDSESYLVDTQIFHVQKQWYANDDKTMYRYVIIQDLGIYIAINITALLQYGDYINLTTSVYESNIMFPVFGKSDIQLTYLDSNSKRMTKSINEIVLNDSDDIQWSVKRDNITASTPPPKVIMFTDAPYIRYINGIEMTSNAVGVTFYTAPSVVDIPPTTLSVGDGVNLQLVRIPGSSSSEAPESPDKLPYKFAGVGKNIDIFDKYNFSMTEPKWTAITQASDAGSGVNYYEQCNPEWVSRATNDGAEAEIPDTGIADLKLKVDGNVPMLPVLPANTITEIPEYRLFNPHFMSEDIVETLVNSVRFQSKLSSLLTSAGMTGGTVGYFRLMPYQGTSKKKVLLCDGGTVNKHLTSSGDSVAAVIKDRQRKLFTFSSKVYKISSNKTLTFYLKAVLDEDRPVTNSKVTLAYTTNPGTDIKDDSVDTRYIIIGRVTRNGRNLNIAQDAQGIITFDFTRNMTNYTGDFAITRVANTNNSVLIKGGRIRVVDKSYTVDDLKTTKTGIAYIEVTMKNDNITSTIKVSDSVPNDTADTSRMIIGRISKRTGAAPVISQEFFGGTPLFLFYSHDCGNTTEKE